MTILVNIYLYFAIFFRIICGLSLMSCVVSHPFDGRNGKPGVASPPNSRHRNRKLGTTSSFFFFFSLISLIADGPHHYYHPACGHKGYSPLSPIHALQLFIAMQVHHSEFYLLTFLRFPLRKKEHKTYFGKDRTHDFRTSKCADYLLDHSGDEGFWRQPTSSCTTSYFLTPPKAKRGRAELKAAIHQPAAVRPTVIPASPRRNALYWALMRHQRRLTGATMPPRIYTPSITLGQRIRSIFQTFSERYPTAPLTFN